MKNKLTKEQIQLMKDDITTELVGFLIDEFHFSIAEALDTLYTSETYDRLQDGSTGFYYQSPAYVYSFLSNEVKTGVVS